MGEAGRFDALERAVEGSLAEGSLGFDGDAGVLSAGGVPLAATGALIAAGAGGVGLLVSGALLSLTGLDGPAGLALAPGVSLLLLSLAFVLLLRFTPLPRLWPRLELRFTERVIARRGVRVPFGELRPEHLVWRDGRFFRRLYVRHPRIRGPLAEFFENEGRQADEFHRRLWELIGTAGPSGSLTPVQRWILGAAAQYGAFNGFRLDRLGTAPGTEAAAADRRAAHELLRDPWGAYDLEQLLGAANWLVQDGHRAGFAHDAELAARPPAEREEYASLLREIDTQIAGDQLEPPFIERLIELVRIRYGAEGPEYARLVPSLLRDEPGADVGEEGSELSRFLNALFNDRDHAAEELHRLEALTDPELRANAERFLVWDYGRALMLYRWGRMVGWLTEEYCWDRMLPLAIDVQRRYTSWHDMATCYLQGRLLWSGGTGDGDRSGHEALVDELAADPHSPWNLTAWNLDLRRDWT
ncbi:DUF1266 domain-containing protein [Actinomadura xylanilytica]|uniref:DUF1266 domain-containing protein n=1 Tax=Actinomadura xylanilytica TaxID=887459 RepID=UPI00255B03D9|nr:DUF1266 domain-containing protein [Actinomadura xylanilytica]MDL4772844.1 DUF1266 domain-containing protein [Actinomadura xylanilytica]